MIVIRTVRLCGGVAGMKAVSGLEAAAGQEKGGITQRYFVAAFLVPQGGSHFGIMSPEGTPTSALI